MTGCTQNVSRRYKEDDNFHFRRRQACKIFVHSIGKYEYFAVKEAQFSLIYNGEEEISGECEIEKDEEKHGYYIDVKIQPAQKSKLYVLEITLKIADEIIKNREKMEVI